MSQMCWLALILVSIIAPRSALHAQEAAVNGRVIVIHTSASDHASHDVVVSLTSAGSGDPALPGPTVRLVQKNKRFSPHMLVVTPGTQVEFPNQDPFFHDVFSIYRGKPFDLGLYESGASRKVRFSQVGVSFIFCNIHPEMSAAVVVLRTPHFAVTSRDGSFRISHVPPGHYKLEVWAESAAEAELASQARDLEVTPGDNPPVSITVRASGISKEHLNKYGEAYPPPKADKY